jgi:hypothetical protein
MWIGGGGFYAVVMVAILAAPYLSRDRVDRRARSFH